MSEMGLEGGQLQSLEREKGRRKEEPCLSMMKMPVDRGGQHYGEADCT